MKRIGIVDIDTSHAGTWIPILRELGYDIAGIHDHGNIHPPEVAQRFAAGHKVPLFSDLPRLIGASDIGFVLSCNWDRHVKLAEGFVLAGKSVFVDKPLAGNPGDLRTLLAWEQSGRRITGGSCMLYAREIADYLRATSTEAGTRAHTLLGGCGIDDFNYGIHAFSSAFAVFGFDWFKVRASAEGRLRVAHLLWRNGDQAVLTFGDHPWIQSHLTLIAEKGLQHVRIAVAGIYRPMLEAILPYLAGETDPPVRLTDLVQVEYSALAVRRSLIAGGRWIERSEIDPADTRYEGQAFEAAYRRQRYPDPTGT